MNVVAGDLSLWRRQEAIHKNLFFYSLSGTMSHPMDKASFSIHQLMREREKSGKTWLEFLRVASLSMGVYHVPARTEDRSSHDPHDEDEAYYVVSGQGRLHAGDAEFELEPGSIAFVGAGVRHFFHDVSEDLTLLVFFSASARERG